MPLKPQQVDIDSRVISLLPSETKNNQGGRIPIYGDMVSVLTAQLATLGRSQWLFHRGRKPIRGFCKSWDEACERAGPAGLLFHDLRRSAVRNMVWAGIPEQVVMEISGHKTRAIFDRYNIVDESDIHEAGRKAAAYLGKGKEQRDSGQSVTKTVAVAGEK